MRILITGASSGLGAEMARQFAARGHDLVLTARRVERLASLRDELVATHPERRVEVAGLDVNSADDVFAVFRAHAPLGRVIVNAGVGQGIAVGTGGHEHNAEIATTNFVAGVTQVEAAMELFRAQEEGHLVVISSITAIRGMREGAAVYSAAKRGIAALAEGVRSETLGTAIDVSVAYPGYIESEMTASNPHAPFKVDTETGVRAIVKGVEARRANIYAPRWPWAPLSVVFRLMPLPLVSRLTRPSITRPVDKITHT